MLFVSRLRSMCLELGLRPDSLQGYCWHVFPMENVAEASADVDWLLRNMSASHYLDVEVLPLLWVPDVFPDGADQRFVFQ